MLALLLNGCEPGRQPQPDQFTVTDSAGIRIVSHAASAQPSSTWRVESQPVLSIGGTNGTGPTEFADIWDVARTSDGKVVVTDAPAEELRVFDAQGNHLRTMGRRGEGPGEFSQVQGVEVYGDTIYALDPRRGTAVFTVDGAFVRQSPYPSLDGYRAINVGGALADGWTITIATPPHRRLAGSETGTHIEQRGLFRIAPDSRSATLLTTIPTFEHYRAEGDPPGGHLVAFAPWGSVAVLADAICTGRATHFEIRCMSGAGKLRLIIRRDITPTPISEAVREEYRADARIPRAYPGHPPLPQDRLDRLAARTRFAEYFPVFDRFVAGKDGTLWVSEYRYRPPQHATDPGEPSRWNVFASDGSWIAAVELPARFLLKEAGEDYVLGVAPGENDVPVVVMFRLLRN